MQSGKVKWWNDEKGFGFITLDDAPANSRDIFVHYSVIELRAGARRRSLTDGQSVECEVIDGPKGPQATKVQVIH